MALLKAARKNKAKPYRQAKLYHLRLSPAAKAGDNHKFFQKAGDGPGGRELERKAACS